MVAGNRARLRSLALLVLSLFVVHLPFVEARKLNVVTNAAGVPTLEQHDTQALDPVFINAEKPPPKYQGDPVPLSGFKQPTAPPGTSGPPGNGEGSISGTVKPPDFDFNTSGSSSKSDPATPLEPGNPQSPESPPTVQSSTQTSDAPVEEPSKDTPTEQPAKPDTKETVEQQETKKPAAEETTVQEPLVNKPEPKEPDSSNSGEQPINEKPAGENGPAKVDEPSKDTSTEQPSELDTKKTVEQQETKKPVPKETAAEEPIVKNPEPKEPGDQELTNGKPTEENGLGKKPVTKNPETDHPDAKASSQKTSESGKQGTGEQLQDPVTSKPTSATPSSGKPVVPTAPSGSTVAEVPDNPSTGTPSAEKANSTVTEVSSSKHSAKPTKHPVVSSESSRKPSGGDENTDASSLGSQREQQNVKPIASKHPVVSNKPLTSSSASNEKADSSSEGSRRKENSRPNASEHPVVSNQSWSKPSGGNEKADSSSGESPRKEHTVKLNTSPMDSNKESMKLSDGTQNSGTSSSGNGRDPVETSKSSVDLITPPTKVVSTEPKKPQWSSSANPNYEHDAELVSISDIVHGSPHDTMISSKPKPAPSDSKPVSGMHSGEDIEYQYFPEVVHGAPMGKLQIRKRYTEKYSDSNVQSDIGIHSPSFNCINFGPEKQPGMSQWKHAYAKGLVSAYSVDRSKYPVLPLAFLSHVAGKKWTYTVKVGYQESRLYDFLVGFAEVYDTQCKGNTGTSRVFTVHMGSHTKTINLRKNVGCGKIFQIPLNNVRSKNGKVDISFKGVRENAMVSVICFSPSDKQKGSVMTDLESAVLDAQKQATGHGSVWAGFADNRPPQPGNSIMSIHPVQHPGNLASGVHGSVGSQKSGSAVEPYSDVQHGDPNLVQNTDIGSQYVDESTNSSVKYPSIPDRAVCINFGKGIVKRFQHANMESITGKVNVYSTTKSLNRSPYQDSYRSHVFGKSFSYDLETAKPSKYTIAFGFAEIFEPLCSEGASEKRVFKVMVGSKKPRWVNVFKSSGCLNAHIEIVEGVKSDKDGHVEISLEAVSNSAMLSNLCYWEETSEKEKDAPAQKSDIVEHSSTEKKETFEHSSGFTVKSDMVKDAGSTPNKPAAELSTSESSNSKETIKNNPSESVKSDNVKDEASETKKESLELSTSDSKEVVTSGGSKASSSEVKVMSDTESEAVTTEGLTTDPKVDVDTTGAKKTNSSELSVQSHTEDSLPVIPAQPSVSSSVSVTVSPSSSALSSASPSSSPSHSTPAASEYPSVSPSANPSASPSTTSSSLPSNSPKLTPEVSPSEAKPTEKVDIMISISTPILTPLPKVTQGVIEATEGGHGIVSKSPSPSPGVESLSAIDANMEIHDTNGVNQYQGESDVSPTAVQDGSTNRGDSEGEMHSVASFPVLGVLTHKDPAVSGSHTSKSENVLTTVSPTPTTSGLPSVSANNKETDTGDVVSELSTSSTPTVSPETNTTNTASQDEDSLSKKSPLPSISASPQPSIADIIAAIPQVSSSPVMPPVESLTVSVSPSSEKSGEESVTISIGGPPSTDPIPSVPPIITPSKDNTSSQDEKADVTVGAASDSTFGSAVVVSIGSGESSPSVQASSASSAEVDLEDLIPTAIPLENDAEVTFFTGPETSSTNKESTSISISFPQSAGDNPSNTEKVLLGISDVSPSSMAVPSASSKAGPDNRQAGFPIFDVDSSSSSGKSTPTSSLAASASVSASASSSAAASASASHSMSGMPSVTPSTSKLPSATPSSTVSPSPSVSISVSPLPPTSKTGATQIITIEMTPLPSGVSPTPFPSQDPLIVEVPEISPTPTPSVLKGVDIGDPYIQATPVIVGPYAEVVGRNKESSNIFPIIMGILGSLLVVALVGCIFIAFTAGAPSSSASRSNYNYPEDDGDYGQGGGGDYSGGQLSGSDGLAAAAGYGEDDDEFRIQSGSSNPTGDDLQGVGVDGSGIQVDDGLYADDVQGRDIIMPTDLDIEDISGTHSADDYADQVGYDQPANYDQQAEFEQQSIVAGYSANDNYDPDQTLGVDLSNGRTEAHDNSFEGDHSIARPAEYGSESSGNSERVTGSYTGSESGYGGPTEKINSQNVRDQLANIHHQIARQFGDERGSRSSSGSDQQMSNRIRSGITHAQTSDYSESTANESEFSGNQQFIRGDTAKDGVEPEVPNDPWPYWYNAPRAGPHASVYNPQERVTKGVSLGAPELLASVRDKLLRVDPGKVETATSSDPDASWISKRGSDEAKPKKEVTFQDEPAAPPLRSLAQRWPLNSESERGSISSRENVLSGSSEGRYDDRVSNSTRTGSGSSGKPPMEPRKSMALRDISKKIAYNREMLKPTSSRSVSTDSVQVHPVALGAVGTVPFVQADMERNRFSKRFGRNNSGSEDPVIPADVEELRKRREPYVKQVAKRLSDASARSSLPSSLQSSIR